MSDLLEVVKEHLDYVNKMINPANANAPEQLSARTPRSRTRREGARSKTAEPSEPAEPTEVLKPEVLANALAALQTAVSNLAEVVKINKDASVEAAIAPQEEAGKSRIRHVEDDLDEEKQKNLKGKFIISSSDKRGKETFIKSDETLKSEKKDLADHVVDLALKKYEVTLPKADIAYCTRVHSGGIIFSIWNQKPGSGNSIKSTKNLATNIYFNFMLTKRRSTLLFEARKLKRDNMITKFLSDEHGSISIKKDDTKEKITSIMDKENKQVKTWTVEELLAKYRHESQ